MFNPMTTTLNPSLEATVQRRADELNAARPLDPETSQPIGATVTAQEVLNSNVNAIVQSWEDAYRAEDIRALATVGEEIVAATPAKQAAAIAAALAEVRA